MADWKTEIKSTYGICYITNQIIRFMQAKDVLWTTRCCSVKLCKKGLPYEMYDSYVTRYFYRFVLAWDLPFAILSDKYGLHFANEKFPRYDIHPSVLSIGRKTLLGKRIRKKAELRGFKKIVFYNNSPLMSKPYFEMLSDSGLEIFFTTKLTLHSLKEKGLFS